MCDIVSPTLPIPVLDDLDRCTYCIGWFSKRELCAKMLSLQLDQSFFRSYTADVHVFFLNHLLRISKVYLLLSNFFSFNCITYS